MQSREIETRSTFRLFPFKTDHGKQRPIPFLILLFLSCLNFYLHPFSLPNIFLACTHHLLFMTILVDRSWITSPETINSVHLAFACAQKEPIISLGWINECTLRPAEGALSGPLNNYILVTKKLDLKAIFPFISVRNKHLYILTAVNEFDVYGIPIKRC